MKIYKVCDDGTPLPIVTNLAELGRLFLKLSKKHQLNSIYWVDEENI